MPKSLISILLLSIGIITNAQTVHLQRLHPPALIMLIFWNFPATQYLELWVRQALLQAPFILIPD
jgi:hypothetical protein